MASTINGTSTGNGGLISTGDDSGILNIQTNETNAITVDASQNVGIGTTSQIDFGLISVAANLNLLYHLVLKNTVAQAGGQSYQRFLNSANAKTGSKTQ